MKKLTLAMLISFVICLFSSVVSNANDVQNTTDKFIRLHVIANSDSERDQEIKLTVRDAVLSEADALLKGCESKENAIAVINDNLEGFTNAANEALDNCGYTAVCSLEKTTFDKRVYDDFSLPAGVYDSLLVNLGSASGKNWWCVCYPELCLPSAVRLEECKSLSENDVMILKTPEKVRYKLFCFELIRKIKSIFVDQSK